MSEALIRQIRERMAAGTLPCEDCVVTWYGHGRGRPCAACDREIVSTHDEIECTIQGGGLIYFHRACYELWHGLL